MIINFQSADGDDARSNRILFGVSVKLWFNVVSLLSENTTVYTGCVT